jgi:hypothetical protein
VDAFVDAMLAAGCYRQLCRAGSLIVARKKYEQLGPEERIER